jgi:hypothetical protein
MESIQLEKSQFEELNFYKKLVENNLKEELGLDELNEILKGKETKILGEKEFLELNPDLKNV